MSDDLEDLSISQILTAYFDILIERCDPEKTRDEARAEKRRSVRRRVTAIARSYAGNGIPEVRIPLRAPLLVCHDESSEMFHYVTPEIAFPINWSISGDPQVYKRKWREGIEAIVEYEMQLDPRWNQKAH